MNFYNLLKNMNVLCRFEGKRVVIRQSKTPFNYYLLLAGSAVVIKSDESGNTNPVLFMKRGDVFGVRISKL